ncbi:hypothetical protein [Larkinella soli]|uniref:hypothetical protein n=1 Tax=Larkinella soli TaxID=1770527 RepID=UPI000FFB907B|nr:hypothetical protein [Larkinella soli]
MKKPFLHFIGRIATTIIFLCGQFVFGQQTVDEEKLKPFSFNVEAGVSARSTLMNFLNFRRVDAYDPIIPFNYEKHLQGTAVNLGFSFFCRPIKSGLAYSPSFRYDIIHGTFSIPNYKKDFLTEHHVFAYKAFWLNPKRKKYHYLGLGIGIMNPGKKYLITKEIGNGNVRLIKQDFYLNMQYNVIDIRFGVPISRRFWIEPIASIIPKTFPVNKRDTFIMYSLKFSYSFKPAIFN